MDLELVRADLLQLDPVSNFGTIALLPKGKKGKVCFWRLLYALYFMSRARALSVFTAKNCGWGRLRIYSLLWIQKRRSSCKKLGIRSTWKSLMNVMCFQTVFSVRPFQTPVSCVVITGIAMKGDKVYCGWNHCLLYLSKKFYLAWIIDICYQRATGCRHQQEGKRIFSIDISPHGGNEDHRCWWYQDMVLMWIYF